MRSAFLRIAVVSCTIFFLLFLGMRLSFLDNTSKPKPRPRAVLNLFAKLPPGSLFSAKPSFNPSLDEFCVLQSSSIIPLTCTRYHYTALQVSYSVSPEALLSKGRSPPLS